MHMQYIYTRLNVENFEECKAFYRDVLGLVVKFEDEQDEYAEFDTGTVPISLFNRKKLKDFVTRDVLTYDRHSAQIVLSFKVEDLNAEVARIQSHGVELLNPPTNYPGRNIISACFRDPDGNLIDLEQMLN